jgi:Kef-type K+ transport system membrane component KefB
VVSTKIGMAAIIGAFFAGLAFADFSDSWNLEPRAQAINQFLSPFFFFTMGARLDLTVFTGPVVTTAIVVSILAIITKMVGCGLPMMKEGWRDALKVGVGMTPRGEVALIVALIGLQMDMISQRAYAVVIFMAAVTTILPPPMLKLLHRGDVPTGGVDMEIELSVEEQVAEQNVRGEIG